MNQNIIKKILSEELNKLEKATLFNNQFPLSVTQYDQSDIFNLIKTLTNGWPTIGKQVKKIEGKIKKLLKIKHSIMLNSGGSANYLMLYLLSSPYAKKEHKLKPGDEILTPAVTWSTTVSPIIQNNFVPVLLDVNLSTYDMNVNLIERSITKKTRAIMLVHPLGHVCNMKAILKICKKYNLVLLEDTCESIGAKYNNKFAGTFGLFSSISFYQSHHISGVEGGMLLTNNDYYADVLRSMRANGWLREVTNKKNAAKIIKNNKNIDKSFMFPYIGFNFKPTDMSAALLDNQINRLNYYIKIRTLAARSLIKGLEKYKDFLILPVFNKNIKNSWFTFPIVVKKNKKFTKKKLVNHLTKNKVSNRPIIAGNIAEQPFLKNFKYKKANLNNSKIVMESGFFIGLHHKLNKKSIKKLISIFDVFFKNNI